MADFASDEGARRRLPSWMLGVSTDEGVVASKAKRKSKNAESLQEDEAVDFSKPVKRRKRKFNGKDDDCDTESGLQKNTRNAARRKLRKPTTESIEDMELSSVVDDHCKDTVIAFGNKKSKGVKRKARGSTSKENVEIVSTLDSGDELTAEDLVRIAKEYVEADMVIEKPESPRVEDELETQFAATASHRTEEEGSPIAGHRNGSTLIDTSKTGDPAIDMLDLYLGSLLRRKPLVEKRTESVTKDVAFTSDLGRRNSENVREEETVLESEKKKKKKSSLREKVGLFVD